MKHTFYILLFLTFSSCINPTHQVMDFAESLMDVQPDSALALLKSISEEELKSQEEYARFALLYSQALDKNKIFVKNDSLIKIAVEFYEDSRNLRYKMLSNLYWSSTLYEKKSYLLSLKAALKAKKIAIDLDDNYYLGLIDFSIYDIFIQVHMQREALAAAEEAINAFRLAGKEEHLDWAYYYKAKALYNLDSIEESRAVLDSIFDVAKKKNNSGLIYYSNMLYLNVFSRSQNPATRDSIPIIFSSIKTPTVADYTEIIEYFTNINQLDSAKYYIDRVGFSKSTYQAKLLEYVIAKYEFKSGDAENAFNRIHRTIMEMDSVYHSFSRIGLASFQTDFYQEEAKIAEENSKKAHQVSILTICLIVLLALLFILLFRNKIKRKEEELSLSLDVAANLRREIMNNKQLSDNMKNKIDLLMKSQFDTLTGLCETYYQMKSKNKFEIGLTKKVHEIIKEFRYAENMNEIEEIVNQEQNNILCRLLDDAGSQGIFFTDREKTLLIYILAGFPATTTTILLEISLSNYYTVKSRLKNKIQAIETVAAKEVFENYF